MKRVSPLRGSQVSLTPDGQGPVGPESRIRVQRVGTARVLRSDRRAKAVRRCPTGHLKRSIHLRRRSVRLHNDDASRDQRCFAGDAWTPPDGGVNARSDLCGAATVALQVSSGESKALRRRVTPSFRVGPAKFTRSRHRHIARFDPTQGARRAPFQPRRNGGSGLARRAEDSG
jgi:hypothetical protein